MNSSFDGICELKKARVKNIIISVDEKSTTFPEAVAWTANFFHNGGSKVLILFAEKNMTPSHLEERNKEMRTMLSLSDFNNFGSVMKTQPDYDDKKSFFCAIAIEKRS
jgi:hypothetical protein